MIDQKKPKDYSKSSSGSSSGYDKVTISIPHSVRERIDKRAAQRGQGRSGFLTLCFIEFEEHHPLPPEA